SIHIDQIPVDFGLRVPLSATISGGTFDITTVPFTVPQIAITGISNVTANSTVGPINVPTITISGPRLNLLVGGPTYTLFAGISGTVGPIDIP
ncbi:hypothetical protein ACLILY_32475, partial [Mycobacterium sp. MS3]